MPSEHEPQKGNTGSHLVIGAIVVIMALMTLVFAKIMNYLENPNQEITGKSTARYNEIRLTRNDYGHYVGNGRINGTRVFFMVDTGATGVAVPIRLAEKIGLKRGRAVTMITAKGPGTSYLTQIGSLSIGTVRFNNIRGFISQNTDDNDVLLGMNVLKHLEIIQRGKIMILRQYKK